MNIRKFHDDDVTQIVDLFFNTVHLVNKDDYTKEQLNAWAPPDEQATKHKLWRESFHRNVTYVAIVGETIVGFSDMTYNGHLDRLYVHKDCQRRGIATALAQNLESEARSLGITEIDTEASITSKPFFEQLGYRVVHKQNVERRGVLLTNFMMVKSLIN